VSFLAPSTDTGPEPSTTTTAAPSTTTTAAPTAVRATDIVNGAWVGQSNCVPYGSNLKSSYPGLPAVLSSSITNAKEYDAFLQGGWGYPQGAFPLNTNTEPHSASFYKGKLNKPCGEPDPPKIRNIYRQIGAGCAEGSCLAWSPDVFARLMGMKYADFNFNNALLTELKSKSILSDKKKKRFDGVMFDFEYVTGYSFSTAGSRKLFNDLYNAIVHLQTLGLKVGMTWMWMPHSWRSSAPNTIPLPVNSVKNTNDTESVVACPLASPTDGAAFPGQGPQKSWCKFLALPYQSGHWDLSQLSEDGKSNHIFDVLDIISPMVYTDASKNNINQNTVTHLINGTDNTPALRKQNYHKVMWSCSLNTTDIDYSILSQITGSRFLFYAK